MSEAVRFFKNNLDRFESDQVLPEQFLEDLLGHLRAGSRKLCLLHLNGTLVFINKCLSIGKWPKIRYLLCLQPSLAVISAILGQSFRQYTPELAKGLSQHSLRFLLFRQFKAGKGRGKQINSPYLAITNSGPGAHKVKFHFNGNKFACHAQGEFNAVEDETVTH